MTIQSLIDAISGGALYGLAALGIGLVFGIMRLINFAHGELITVSAYTLILTWQWGPALSIALSVLVAVAVAMAMETVVYRHMRGANPATLLIASFGLSFVLQRVFELIFGTNVRSAAVGTQMAQSIQIGSVRIQLLSVITIGVTAVLVVGLVLFLRRTSWGLQVQAASTDLVTARILGVRVNFVIGLTFAISGILAAAVGFALTVRTGAVSPTFGVQITVLALIGAVIGGVEKLVGSMVGGFIVGFVTSQFNTWLPTGYVSFRDAFVYLIVIVILLVKPSGLVTRRQSVERA